jgi:hypothetical protein
MAKTDESMNTTKRTPVIKYEETFGFSKSFVPSIARPLTDANCEVE